MKKKLKVRKEWLNSDKKIVIKVLILVYTILLFFVNN